MPFNIAGQVALTRELRLRQRAPRIFEAHRHSDHGGASFFLSIISLAIDNRRVHIIGREEELVGNSKTHDHSASLR